MDASTSKEFIRVYGQIQKLRDDVTVFAKEYYDASVVSYDEIANVPENLSQFNNDTGFVTEEEVDNKILNSFDDSNFLKKSGEEEQQECSIPTEFGELYAETPDDEDSSNRVATTEFVQNVANTDSIVQSVVGIVGRDYVTSQDVQQAINLKIGQHEYNNVVSLVAGEIQSATNEINDTIENIDIDSHIPTNVSSFTNDAGYITLSQVPPDAVTSVNGQTGNVQLTIPVVPTNVSSFTNDAGYITDAGVTSVNNNTGAVSVQENVLADWSATTGLASILHKPALKRVATSGDYNDLDNTPEIPKGSSIYRAVMDSTSTSTNFVATAQGLTELTDGVCCYLTNDVIDAASGCTLNINNLGAKPIYGTYYGSRMYTSFSLGKTFLFIYNSTRIDGGCWDAYMGYYETDTDTIGQDIRISDASLPILTRSYRYRIFFTSFDHNYWVPANSATTTNSTIARTVTQEKIDPFGRIVYYDGSAALPINTKISALHLWDLHTLVLGYSFNRTGAALTLTAYAPVYVKCTPLSDGSAIIDGTEPFTLSLPSTEDGFIYIYLGLAYDATHISMVVKHPVYYYKNGAIKQWTGSEDVASNDVAEIVVKTEADFANYTPNANTLTIVI